MKKLIQDEIKMVTDLFKWVDKETEAKLLKKGKTIGIKEGEERGIKKEKKRLITQMLKENMKIEEIMKYTNISKKEIQNIEKQISAK